MRAEFISEPIRPVAGTFDAGMMSNGEPGLPQRFCWRKKEYAVAEILERSKVHGDCAHGSGERYVRRHVYRIRTEQGEIMSLYFQRSVGKGKVASSRWWLYSVEQAASR